MELNHIQKLVLCIIFWVIVSLIIFPPFQDIMYVRKINCGSPFIFGTHYCPMDTSRLLIRLIGTVLIGGAVFLLVSLFKKK